MSIPASPTFCMLPWVHLNVWTDGNVYPCCVADNKLPLGSVRNSALSEIWNSAALRRIRLNMLSDRPSPECHQCYEIERSGFPSRRRLANEQFASHASVVEETDAGGAVRAFRLPYLDIRFSNVCNFRCRTCSPDLSSAWHEDGKRLYGDHDGPALITATRDPEELWRQVEPLLPHVEEIYFAGGEPLVMEEHYRILDALERRGRYDVCLLYNTNFSVTRYNGRDVVAIWKKFKTVRVGASLDGMGARGEYLRKGQKWEQVLANRERMSRECPRAEFHVIATFSLMNALHLPDFHRDWLTRGYIGPRGFYLNLLLRPPEYRAQVLPETYKRAVADKYRRHVEDVLAPLGPAATTATSQFTAAVKFMLERDRSGDLPRFHEVTKLLDEAREERFTDVFPEFADLLERGGARERR